MRAIGLCPGSPAPPARRLEKALVATAQAADRLAGSGGQLGSRPVKVVDASTTQVADTPQNQKIYPQPSSQKKGCGFPVIRFLALLSLNSGSGPSGSYGQSAQPRVTPVPTPRRAVAQGDIILGTVLSANTPPQPLCPAGVDLVARCTTSAKWTSAKLSDSQRRYGLFVWTKGCQQSKSFRRGVGAPSRRNPPFG